MPPIVSDSYKEKKKKEILSSALVCFAKKGFQVATIDDIVEHSGISKGSIYNYFKSKDEIYLALMTTETEETNELLTKDLDAYHHAMEKINYLFDVYLTLDVIEDETHSKIIVHNEFKLHAARHADLLEKLTTRRQQYLIHLFAQIIREGQGSGEFKQELNPELTANLFWSMIDGVTVQSIYKDYPYNQVLTEMKRLFLEKVKA
ncbi:TetR/AcrR family transcriptional regulator [Neobacillus sp. MM2021_6]|uniref:TetR/AcrR family transcriptional regulator n=1 Tax=Bacillaceae TaxID=186817 RepID=UPI00140C5C1A|nr:MULTISPECIES: TetR/AcrR family transcriptional regulator [Bacillaceae]MBO0960954.1 TetR/AcrR family transcriptional regulator [Neobacillus sp. MM2021_6]NHC21361.1 TetR/AcrR family transcriptional regulator [Bacillus sp. MM2020_4]